MSTFHGIELAKKALAAQQGGLYTTGHNISNVNTEGYSRQRVNFETTSPFPMPSRVMPQIAGQIGTGVEIGTVERVRDQFLDAQYRTENSSLSYWDTKSEALTRMEELLNEPSENGLNAQMDLFWQSLHDIADHPDNSGARSVVAQRGLALAETFNHLSRSLQSIKVDLKEQIDVSAGNINSLVNQINGLNEQIQKIEPHGMLANDLYDERDRLIDQLSEHMNIRVEYNPSSASSLEIADGLATIEVLDSNGKSIGQNGDPVFLIDARDYDIDSEVHEIKVESMEIDGTELISSISVDDENVTAGIIQSNGSFNAIVEAHGWVDGGENNLYPQMIENLNQMAKQFAIAFNAVHTEGVGMHDDASRHFFDDGDGQSNSITAENITVNSSIMEDPNKIAAGVPGGGSSNGENALKLKEVLDDEDIGLDNASIRGFYASLIGEMGVKGQEAKSMKDSSSTLRAQVEHSRQSVTAVSLDEEISNLIKFQHAYNAAARSMTATDELLDKVINQMGLVGR